MEKRSLPAKGQGILALPACPLAPSRLLFLSNVATFFSYFPPSSSLHPLLQRQIYLSSIFANGINAAQACEHSLHSCEALKSFREEVPAELTPPCPGRGIHSSPCHFFLQFTSPAILQRTAGYLLTNRKCLWIMSILFCFLHIGSHLARCPPRPRPIRGAEGALSTPSLTQNQAGIKRALSSGNAPGGLFL